MTLKDRLITAINAGALGHKDKHGVFFTKKEFAAYFSDITERYTSAFLPAATIGEGRTRASHTKYLFRIGKGVYRVHGDVLDITPGQVSTRDFYRLLNKIHVRELRPSKLLAKRNKSGLNIARGKTLPLK